VVQLQRTVAFARARLDQIQEAATFVQRSFDSPLVQSVLYDMAGKPGHFMWPWDGAAPHSLAHGILDDVTYDWYYLLRAVLASGGRAEILTEDSIRSAYDMAQRHTGIPVCPTGASGLAGLIQLQISGAIDPGKAVGLFFTGFDRSKAE
jgi:threonine synthase